MDDYDLDGINYFIWHFQTRHVGTILLISQALDAMQECTRKFGPRLKFSLNTSGHFAVIYSFRYVLVDAQTAQST